MFYDKYARICKRRGISMSKAAVEAGLSKSLVTKWKVNKVDVPSPDVLKKLSVYFDMPVSELLGEKEKATVQDDGLTENKRLLMQFVDSVPEDKAAKVLRLMQAILEDD